MVFYEKIMSICYLQCALKHYFSQIIVMRTSVFHNLFKCRLQIHKNVYFSASIIMTQWNHFLTQVRLDKPRHQTIPLIVVEINYVWELTIGTIPVQFSKNMKNQSAVQGDPIKPTVHQEYEYWLVYLSLGIGHGMFCL